MKRFTLLKSFLLLCALIAGAGTAWATDVTINFGTATNYWSAHTSASYTDSDNRVWTRVCSVNNMSGQAAYSQFGNTSNTPTVTLSATAGSDMTITAFSVTMAGASGGNSPTTGTIYLYKKSGDNETELATASVDGTTSVTCSISSSQAFSSTDELEVKYVGTNKAIRVTKLTYSYTTSGGSSDPSVSLTTYNINATEDAVSTTSIEVTYNNLTNYVADVNFYEADGTTDATYDHSWLTAEINATTNNLDYSITANTGASRTAFLKVYAVGDEGDAESSLIIITQAAKSVTAPTFSLDGGSYMVGTKVTITSEGNTIYYTTDGTPPTASSAEYTEPVSILAGKKTYKAIAKDTYGNFSGVTTRTYTGITPTSLPFSWTGTSSAGKDDLAAKTGVALNLASDYAESNAPYRLKFDGTSRYVIIYTNEKPEAVSFTAKLFENASTGTKMKVQASADGVDFTDIEEFTIKGSANATFQFKTSNAFAATHRAVKLAISSKDKNVGVGSISISAAPVSATVTAAGWATWVAPVNVTVPSGAEAYAVALNGIHTDLTALTAIPAGTPVLLKNEGTYQFPVTTETPAAVTTALKVSEGTAVANAYVLAKKNDVVGFYKWIGTDPIPAGKVYLVYTASSAPDFIGFGDATGISSIENGQVTIDNSEVYNLAGQRVAQPTKGLYIINGKKYVVK